VEGLPWPILIIIDQCSIKVVGIRGANAAVRHNVPLRAIRV